MHRALDAAASLRLVLFDGFKYKSAREYMRLTRERPCADAAMRRRLMAELPFSPRYDRMFSEPLTTRMVMPDYAACFPAVYAVKLGGRGEFCRAGHAAEPAMDTADVMALIRRETSVLLRKDKDSALSELPILSCIDGDWQINGKSVTEKELTDRLERLSEGSLLCENLLQELPDDFPMIHVAVLNGTPEAEIVSCSVYAHGENGRFRLYGRKTEQPAVLAEEEKALILRIASRFPEIDYMGFSLVRTEKAVRIFSISTGMDLAASGEIPAAVSAYLAGRGEHKPKGGWKRLQKYIFAWRAQRHGFVDYMYRSWLKGLREDRHFTGTSRREKRWANKRGFYSWRIAQYGLTEENYREVLSDRDYKRLRPINNSFYKWFWNKKISAYVLQPYRAYIPQTYFWTCVRGGEWSLCPFGDVGSRSMDDLLTLLREKGRLAMKPAEGSHGIGFRALGYENGQYSVNGETVSEAALRKAVTDCGSDYLITEFVTAHEALRAIYPSVVNTVRIMTIRDGADHFIKHAYLRIGTTATGHTDNLASGGIAASIRLEDGKIYEAFRLSDHVYTPCERHPDTGSPIAGTIPHWDKICALVEELCRFLYPLEYLGFDVAVTEDGFKILEINTHQDLQWYPQYPDEVKDFFRRKLAEKTEIFKKKKREG